MNYMISLENETEYFEPNKPSIIDLYSEDKLDIDIVANTIKNNHPFAELEIGKIRNNILPVKVLYKGNHFTIFLKKVANDKEDLHNINKVLVDDELINKANKCRYYLESYLAAKNNYIEAYYAQIKLLACLSKKPLLILDCTQWCLYSYKYIEHFLRYNVDIVDSNLFKIKYSKNGMLYTEGLERFGIKDIEMDGIETKYQKVCASLLSRLARYFIENGQLPNSCKIYSDVFEQQFYACLIDIEEVLDDLINLNIINKNRSDYLNHNRLYVAVHTNDNLETWYANDQEVLEYLLNNDGKTYYTSPKHFNDEKELAQLTIEKAIDLIDGFDDLSNLMILARNEEISTDWYYFTSIKNGVITLQTNESSLIVRIDDIINWNYRGITPLYEFSLET